MQTTTKAAGGGLVAVIMTFLVSQGYIIVSPDGEQFGAPNLCAELPVIAANVQSVSVDIPKRGQRTRAINAGDQMAALADQACELPRLERVPAICETVGDKDGLFTLGLQFEDVWRRQNDAELKDRMGVVLAEVATLIEEGC